MSNQPVAAPITTFRLLQGADAFDFDLKGNVSRNGVAFGAWTTDAQSRIVITAADGSTIPFTVAWAFSNKNQLTLASAGQTVLTLAPIGTQRPSYETVNAVLKVKPD